MPSPLTPLTPSQLRDVRKLIDHVQTLPRNRRVRAKRQRQQGSEPPRPMNCFLVYRCEKQRQITELCPGANHRMISKIVASWWKAISLEHRRLYQEQASLEKIKHLDQYPDYKYMPKRKPSVKLDSNQVETFKEATPELMPGADIDLKLETVDRLPDPNGPIKPEPVATAPPMLNSHQHPTPPATNPPVFLDPLLMPPLAQSATNAFVGMPNGAPDLTEPLFWPNPVTSLFEDNLANHLSMVAPLRFYPPFAPLTHQTRWPDLYPGILAPPSFLESYLPFFNGMSGAMDYLVFSPEAFGTVPPSTTFHPTFGHPALATNHTH
ncbi:hypothetical protein DM01DRAFT_325204 [Hesseltinella vesiculosa]|uniref:HMG box domain-containing protein n=1 Tax=Hesseltinella vesiculosa TaxID=101127 RepID=A0A1X2GJ98_9FUNG|nr:hypothetical protein DM01DRAFT_325204 [Hesseltinella vesiculosa]